MNINFNETVFTQLSESLDTMFPEIINVFFEETTASIKQLEQEIHNKNLDNIHNIAHKIKSSSKTFGAYGLTDLLEQLEKTNDIESIEKTNILTSIKSEYASVKEHIRSKIA